MFNKFGFRRKGDPTDKRDRIDLPEPCNQMISTQSSPDQQIRPSAGSRCVILSNEEQKLNPVAGGSLFSSANMYQAGSSPGKPGILRYSPAAPGTVDKEPGTRLKEHSFTFRGLTQARSNISELGSQDTSQAFHSEVKQTGSNPWKTGSYSSAAPGMVDKGSGTKIKDRSFTFRGLTQARSNFSQLGSWDTSQAFHREVKQTSSNPGKTGSLHYSPEGTVDKPSTRLRVPRFSFGGLTQTWSNFSQLGSWDTSQAFHREVKQTGSNPGKTGSLHYSPEGTVDKPSTRLRVPRFSFGGLTQTWSNFSQLGSQDTSQAFHSEGKQRTKEKVGTFPFTLGWRRRKAIGCETLGDTDQKQSHPTPAAAGVIKPGTGVPRVFANVGGWHGAVPGGEEQVSNTAAYKGNAFSQWSGNEMACSTSGNAGFSYRSQDTSIDTKHTVTGWNQTRGKSETVGDLVFSKGAVGGEDGITPSKGGDNPFTFSNMNQMGNITDPLSSDSGYLTGGENHTLIKANMNIATAGENVNQMDNREDSFENMELESVSMQGTGTSRKPGTKVRLADNGDIAIPVKKAKKSTFSLSWYEALEQTNRDNSAAVTETLRGYTDTHLRKVTEFYRQRIEEAIEECVEAVSLIILNEVKSNDHCYMEIQQLARDGHQREASKLLLDTVMESGAQAARAMWETFVKMVPNHPKLRKILQEIENKGAHLPMEVSRSQMESRVSNYLKEIQVQHKEFLHEKSKNLLIKIIGGRKVKFSLEDQYTEQIIIVSDPDQSVSRRDLTVSGKRREEGQRKMIKAHWGTVGISQLFRSSFGKSSLSGTAVVSGAAGIGKTTMIQKIVSDWADGKIYPQFQFVLLFRFQDLNNIKGRTSIKKLILDSYPHFGNGIEHLWEDPQGLLFILDSLEEFKEKIDFTNSKRNTLPEHQCFHPDCECEVSDIVRCLIQQKVLKGCSVLVTTRPTELESLREAEINLWAEIVGFLKEQRKEYFQKYFGDQSLAEAAFTHVEQNDILYSMCDNPSYCRIICSSLAPGLRRMQGTQKTLPTTVTQIFATYISNMFKNHEFNIYKHHDLSPEQIRDLVIRTGEMAYMGICDNITQFNEKQLNNFRLERSHTLPGFLTEYLDTDMSQPIFSFIHITLQGFVAALAKYLTVDPQNLTQFLDSAAERGDRFRTFLRFMVGLSSSGSARILGEILGPLPHQTTCTVIDWVKEQTENNLSNNLNIQRKDRRSKLLESLYYLFELQNTGLTRNTVGSGGTLALGHDFLYSSIRLTSVDCSVLAVVISHCDEILELNLNNCCLGTEGIQRLAPVLHKCKELRLRGNNLTDGVKLVSAALRRPECKIQTLDLCSNGLSHTDAQLLAMGLTSNSSLTQLYLRKNKLGDTGVKHLCEALNSWHCKIQTLELCENLIRGNIVDQLSSVLRNNRSLTNLNLNNNKLGDMGFKLLIITLSQQNCPIQTLELEGNGISDTYTEELTRISFINTSLTMVNLSNNLLTDQSIRALQNLIQRHTYLHEIRLQRNKFSPDGSNYLQSLNSHRPGLCVEVYTSMSSKGFGTVT
ncbi:uncharacterized protein LOC144505316 [Mustelus asterias]